MHADRPVPATSVLYYVHDPMCSWCWAFDPIWKQLVERRPPSLTLKRVLGGLAPDTDEPMSETMRAKIRSIWCTIQMQVPDTVFNFDFWSRCTPRRSTHPACRAVIAATRQGRHFEEPMILAIQMAYYLQARNPSDAGTLIELALDLGLDIARFTDDLHAKDTQAELSSQMEFARSLGAHGFPSLILQQGLQRRAIRVDYLDPGLLLERISDTPRAEVDQA